MQKKLLLILLFLFCAVAGHSQWVHLSLINASMNLQAVTYDNKVYVIGGETGQYPVNETAEISVFNCITSVWSPSSDSLSLARAASACVSGDSGFYVVGGRIKNWITSSWPIPSYDATNRIDIFKNGAWHIDSLPDRVWGGRAVKAGSKLIFAGFADSVNYFTSEIYASKKVYIYDESTGVWSTDSLSSARTELGVATNGTLVIFAGGVNGLGAVSNIVDIYNAATGSWTTANLSIARGYVGGTYSNGKFYFAGGVLGGVLNVSTDVIDIYDGSAWTTDHLSVPRAGVMAAAVNNNVYFMGGGEFDLSFLPFPNTGGTYNTVDVLNIWNGSWSQQNFTFPYMDPGFGYSSWHLYAGFATSGNKICVAGGGSMAMVWGNAANFFSPNVEILDVPLGVANIDPSVSFDVFPNPSRGPFTIVLPDVPADIRVLDTYGRDVLKLKTLSHSAELNLDQSGVYLVQVLTPHGTATRKVVIN